MSETAKIEAGLLLLGDIIVFILSLWLTLLVRYLGLPSWELFELHLVPFSFLFLVWVLVYFIAGLYDNHTTLFKERLPGIIFRAQLINIMLAAIFFFVVPYISIAPKTNLLIYLVISCALLVGWRLFLAQQIGVRKVKNALLIATGPEATELAEEVVSNPQRYGFTFTHSFSPDDMMHSEDLQLQILEFIRKKNISVVVADTRDEKNRVLVPVFYNLTYLHTQFSFIDFIRMYERVFYRIPLSALTPTWFLDQVTLGTHTAYDILKRLFDIVIGFVLCIVTILVLPVVAIGTKFEDGGPLFISQMRVGKNNRPVKIYKFRSMTGSDAGSEVLKSALRVTRFGAFLRQSRLDELPQGFNLLKGDISFIGPRPELPPLASEYAEAIPYYNVRHFIKPGLTGWAQIYHQEHPHHGVDITETKNKLSYDLFYLKNRSFILDIMIALKTIKILLQRVGR